MNAKELAYSMSQGLGETAFLYTLWGGSLKAYQGEIKPVNEERSVFRSKTKRFICASESKTIYNAVVWLPVRNDELAIELLIIHNEQQIESLKDRMLHYELKIKTLSDALVEIKEDLKWKTL